MDKLTPQKKQRPTAIWTGGIALSCYACPGKISVTPTKAIANQRDLALAYSPGVAVPCLEIEKRPKKKQHFIPLAIT